MCDMLGLSGRVMMWTTQCRRAAESADIWLWRAGLALKVIHIIVRELKVLSADVWPLRAGLALEVVYIITQPFKPQHVTHG